ncbi:hypothetical protein ASE92_09930 [Pedobacter sp. Leaf41]|jgi:hypothetical protein|uniref:hypothetical protein n=1 Tax=Pedobacter sp. Leaf41 TaxID=1736218 RepID=UPI0007025619|nr:hypothetical protein [Pedobacter sp. Leaf41]KQN34946.1 hypothetical protein ASE92_09930 [Pedobacter sp. Leaf41]
MEKILNAEKVLFNQLHLLSTSFPNINLELNSDAINGLISAMNIHTLQYLNPVKDLLKQLSKLKHIDLPIDEINGLQNTIATFFNKL